MTKLYFSLFLFIITTILFAQKQPDSSFVSAYERKSRTFFTSISIGDKNILRDENILKILVVQELLKQIPGLDNDGAALDVTYRIESPGGYHLSFEQHFSGLPIYDGFIKVNLDKNGYIKSIFDNSFDFSGWNKLNIEQQKNELIANTIVSDFIQKNYPSSSQFTAIENIFVNLNNNQPQVVFRIKIDDIYNGLSEEVLLDRYENILLKKNLKVYFRMQDSVVSAKVFLPDPLTTAHVIYGDKYQDFNDSDVVELNNQRKNVSIAVNFNNDTFYLNNTYVRIEDFSGPGILPVTSVLPFFNFTRGQNGFEDINAYYHINVIQNYIQSIGFLNLNSVIIVDSHGDDLDNSYFISNAGNSRIVYGVGGIDDAEDADVIVHEYGHALSYFASNTNSGFERNGLDEALGDYIASSYSRSIDPFNWGKVFNWDGNNSSVNWFGRSVVSTKHYPEDLYNPLNSGDFYYCSEIFSSVLMEIWTELGKSITDQLVLQSVYSFAPNMTLKDAARLVVQADTALFGGANFKTLFKYFHQRGLMDSIPCDSVMRKGLTVDAGKINNVCKNGRFVLGGDANIIGGESPYSYLWSPSTGLPCPQCSVNVITIDSPINYTFKVVDVNGCFAQDSILVNIDCNMSVFNAFSPNQDGKNESWNIQFLDQYPENEVYIFNRTGSKVWQTKNYDSNGNSWDGNNLKGNPLPDGVYYYLIRYSDKQMNGWVLLKR